MNGTSVCVWMCVWVCKRVCMHVHACMQVGTKARQCTILVLEKRLPCSKGRRMRPEGRRLLLNVRGSPHRVQRARQKGAVAGTECLVCVHRHLGALFHSSHESITTDCLSLSALCLACMCSQLTLCPMPRLHVCIHIAYQQWVFECT